MKKLLLITASTLALSTAPALADPVSLAVAASATAEIGASALTFKAFGATLTGIKAIGAHFAVRAALGYALNSLTPKPSGVSRGYSVNSLGTALPHQIIYGEDVVGGAVFYQGLSGVSDEYLHRCIAFAGHEISSFEAIYVNGEEVTLDGSGFVTETTWGTNTIRIKEHLGTSTQAADSDLVSEIGEWTSAHQAKGIAYLYCRFETASNFPNGVPTITAKIRGKKISDTRNGTTAWDDNPAMIIRDYLLADYGLEEIEANIDTTLFETAADACDLASAYTCNGSFLLDAAPDDIIRSLLSSMGGIFWNYGGNWAIKAADYVAPTITLTEDDLRSPIKVATRHSRRDNFNTVVGTYKGSATNYEPDNYTEVTSGLWVTEDGGIRAATELPLLFTNTETMARRIAQVFLRRNRKQETVTASFGLAAMDLKISDTVMLTVDHLGWSSKVFEVVDWKLAIRGQYDIQVDLILREMSEEVFTGVVDNLEDESNTTLTDESGNNLEAVAA